MFFGVFGASGFGKSPPFRQMFQPNNGVCFDVCAKETRIQETMRGKRMWSTSRMSIVGLFG